MIPPVLSDLLGGNVEVGVAAAAVVLTAVLARVYFGSVLFAPRHVTTWNIVRRIATPILQRAIYRFAPFDIQIENESTREEYAATVEADPRALATTIDEVREVEIPALAGFKTAPDGREERATFVWHVGPRPWPAAPRWLRRYQNHPTVYRREDGRYDVYAHFEANSYRPDLWADHLFKGASFDVQEGVSRTQAALDDAGVAWEIDPSRAEADG